MVDFMVDFKELSSEDKQRVIEFIKENIEKRYVEKQKYAVEATLIDDDPGIEMYQGREIGESEIVNVWYGCRYYDVHKNENQFCGKSGMDEQETIYHVMSHLGLLIM